MSTDTFMFQYLKEKIDKGFPAPRYPDLISDGDYLYIPEGSDRHYLNPTDVNMKVGSTTAKYRVAMFFDGPFFPIRNGACYTIHNLMRALGSTQQVDVSFFNCYRGWDEVGSYHDRVFSTSLFTPKDYYTDTGVLEKALVDQGIEVAHFFDTEVLTTIAPLLRKLNIKILLETQNIDHILLERLRVPTEEASIAKSIQSQALTTADFNLFRSDVDKQGGLELGADPDRSATYKGGIWADDFTFAPRAGSKRLVFLGHMFYQPNENALHAIVANVLPRLTEDYSLTVVGITPPKLVKKYELLPNVTFMDGVDDIDATLREFDIALAPLLEASGTRLKLLDYLASGLPVVATSLAAEGLNPEIEKYMTIEDHLDRYSKAIIEVSQNIEFFQNRARQGRKFIEKEYNWPTCIGPFIDAYERMLKNV